MYFVTSRREEQRLEPVPCMLSFKLFTKMAAASATFKALPWSGLFLNLVVQAVPRGLLSAPLTLDSSSTSPSRRGAPGPLGTNSSFQVQCHRQHPVSMIDVPSVSLETSALAPHERANLV